MPKLCTGCWTELKQTSTGCASCSGSVRGLVHLKDGRGPLPRLDPKYDVLGLLGEGAMGATYLCRDRTVDAPVVAKVILPKYSADDRARALFELEARAQARLRGGPRILTLLGFDSEGDTRYLLVEFAPGGSLEDLPPGPNGMGESELRRTGYQIAEALAYAHRSQILHRDIKPANVFIDVAGGIRVGDFGLAKRISEIRGSIAGTPAFMAPEVFAGGREPVGPPADLYSLGATLHYLATRKFPFDIPWEELVHGKRRPGIASDSPPPELGALRPDLSSDFVSTVHRLLLRDPDDRLHSASECMKSLGSGNGISVWDRTRPEQRTLQTGLFVFVEPVEARLWIDGADRGVCGPDGLLLDGVRPGTECRIKAWPVDAHFAPAEAAGVVWRAHERKEVRLELRRLKGSLRVEAGIPHALIVVESDHGFRSEERLDDSGSIGPLELDAGDYKVAVASPGHEVLCEGVSVPPGRTSILRFTRKPVEKDGLFAVDSVPTGAAVYRDQTFLGSTPLSPRPLRPGPFRLRISHAEADDHQAELMLGPGECLDLGTVSLPPMGVLDVPEGDPSVSFTVDGSPLTGTKPLKSGAYDLCAAREGYQVQVVPVRIVSGARTAPALGPWIPRTADLNLPCQFCGVTNSWPLGGSQEEFPCRACEKLNILGRYVPESAPDPRLGTSIAGLVLHERLGQGSQGVVYRAARPEAPESLAVKVFHESVAGDAAQWNALMRGAVTSSKLNHPRIVRIDRVGIDSERLLRFMVMEFVPAASLEAAVLKSGPLPWDRATRMTAHCAEALMKAHSSGIVHGNVCPRKILLCADGSAKLSDFDQAAQNQRPGTATGTGGAMTVLARGSANTSITMASLPAFPPEAYKGDAPKPPGDIFSLGISYYFALTGRAPFESVVGVISGDPAPLENADRSPQREVWMVLQSMLGKEVRDRYSSAVELHQDLLRILDWKMPRRARPPGGAAGKPRVPPTAETERASPACRSCGHRFESDQVRWCPRCGTDAHGPGAGAPEAARACPSCGSRNHPGSKFCNTCGERLPWPL